MKAIFLLFIMLSILGGCRAPKAFTAQPLPSPSSQPPLLRVYITDADTLTEMDIETYVAGVVAGEMPNHWPLEALKAQSILARTFVLKFITEKESRYPGADISTDIAEAQAFNTAAVNSRIRQAVQETAGMILLTADSQLPYTWFHSHSGGMTETAVHGIDWQGKEPSYTRVTEGCEADTASWSASFAKEEFIAACRAAGADVASCRTVTIASRGSSGRAFQLAVDGVNVNAARLRISLGSTKMRSTLLTSIRVKDDHVTMTGQGYGHGVGMSQWGAHALALAGKSAEEIALHYYKGLELIQVWK